MVKDLKQYKKEGYQIVLLSGSRTRAERLAKDLQEEGLNAFYGQDSDRILQPGEIMVAYKAIVDKAEAIGAQLRA